MKRPALGNLLGYTALTVILTAGAAQSLAGANTVFSDDIVDGNVTSADIKDQGIRYADLKDNAITGKKLLDGSVTGADIGDNSIKGADIDESSLVLPSRPEVVQVVGTGTTVANNLGTTSTQFVDVGASFVATLNAEKDDWIQMQFQANTDRNGSNFIFHYFTFSVNGTDVETGTGAASNRGGITAHYNVDRPDNPGWGTGRINMTYWWKAPADGPVVIKPRHKTDGAGTGTVYVVNNGDINPILSVVNYRH